MTTLHEVDQEKAMATASAIQELSKQIEQHNAKNTLKEAPQTMFLNGIRIITNSSIPEGTIIVPQQFGDLIFTAFSKEDSSE